MDGTLVFNRIKTYLSFRGMEGVTEDLKILTARCGLQMMDLSEGDVITYQWISSLSGSVSLLAVSLDGTNFDFSFQRLQAIDEADFNFGIRPNVQSFPR